MSTEQTFAVGHTCTGKPSHDCPACAAVDVSLRTPEPAWLKVSECDERLIDEYFAKRRVPSSSSLL